MGLSTRNPGRVIGLETEAAVTDGAVVVVGAADNKCALPAGADPTAGVLGLVMRPDGSTAAIGTTIDIVQTGVYPAIASAAITRGALVAVAGATGKVKTVAAGAGVNSMVLGTALESAAADGERIAIELQIHRAQG